MCYAEIRNWKLDRILNLGSVCLLSIFYFRMLQNFRGAKILTIGFFAMPYAKNSDFFYFMVYRVNDPENPLSDTVHVPLPHKFLGTRRKRILAKKLDVLIDTNEVGFLKFV